MFVLFGFAIFLSTLFKFIELKIEVKLILAKFGEVLIFLMPPAMSNFYNLVFVVALNFLQKRKIFGSQPDQILQAGTINVRFCC